MKLDILNASVARIIILSKVLEYHINLKIYLDLSIIKIFFWLMAIPDQNHLGN
jgi:hypothetical protein